MNVGILTRYEPGSMDGITRYTMELVKGLLDQSNDHVFTMVNTREELPIEADPRLLNVKLDEARNRIAASFQRNLRIRSIGRDLDILHGPYHGVPFGPFKRVMTMHDVMPLIEHWHSTEHTLQFKLVVPLMLKTVDRIIAVSEKTKADLIRYYDANEERIEVIHNGVFTKEVAKDVQDRVLKDLSIKGSYILMVSNLAPIKNVVGLIEAFAKLTVGTDRTLVLAGKRPDYKEPYDLVKKHGLGNRVIFTDRISDEAVSSLYANADLYVLPSFSEGFGYTVVEAMAHGLPVTCSNTGALPETVGDAARLFDPNDVGSMTEALEVMLTDEGLRKELIKRGKERARLYSFETTAKKTLELYRQVLED